MPKLKIQQQEKYKERRYNTMNNMKMNMQDKIVKTLALFFAMFLLCLYVSTQPVNAKQTPQTRTISGIYNTDGTIDTTDGQCWKISKRSYAYQNATPITVKFATNRTKSKLDDKIISIKAKSKNKQLVNNYIVRNYDLKAYKIKYIKSTRLTNKMIRERATKHIIYIEICKSVSSGGKSDTQDGKYYVAYNKKVRKGKKVTSYCIWNPCTNYCDDITAVVDNGKIR